MPNSGVDADQALYELGRALSAQAYEFVTPTPATHARVLGRAPRQARTLRDVFGWNRPFTEEALPRPIRDLAEAAHVLERDGAEFRATVRFSTLGNDLFVHSGFPTNRADAVFFGPDTYRFCAFVARSLPRCRRLVDIGCGSGAGGIHVASRAAALVLADVNAEALRMARVNCMLASTSAVVVESDILDRVDGSIDAIIANPPYMRDAARRTYRDGGGDYGEGLSLAMARESLSRLQSGGTLLLYTGAPVVDGRDVFREALSALCARAGATLSYEELDPDVFGEELEQPAYCDVERIAAVGATIVAP